MPELPDPIDTARFLLDLSTGKHGKPETVSPGELPRELALLRAWQTNRLRTTYSDLLETERYRPAVTFFLTDIYAPKDFSQRDADILRLYDLLRRFFPPNTLKFIQLTVELYELTEELDQALAAALFGELGVEETITQADYAEAYRICDNYLERVKQIKLTVEIGRRVDRSVRLPLAGATIRMARRPARRAGWQALHDFIERGYAAFKHMRGADEFLAILKQRETTILERIFSAEPDPFSIEP
jgi:hypothetical protein